MKPARKMSYRLSKSDYLRFLKCPQEFWLSVHQPLLLAEPMTLEHEHLRQQGYLVESYARQLAELQSDTSIFVDFQRTFQTSDIWARSDVVISDRRSSEIEICEIKSSASVKEEHYDDLAFQWIAAERAGHQVNRASILIVNKEYVREGDIDVEQLFVRIDVTEAVRAILRETEDNIRRAYTYLTQVPVASLAEYCIDRKLDCQFIKAHFNELPDYTVFDLLFLKHEKRRELLSRDIVDIVAVPDGFPLSDKQRLQVQVAKSRQSVIDRAAIAARLNSWEYPLHFLDYETFAYAIPQFDGIRPFQQMVFQYSLHTIDAPGAEPRHSGYLSFGAGDPARDVAEHLRDAMGGEIGTVLVWYEAFEKGRNEEMAEMYPDLAGFFREVNAHTVDLMKIFSDNLYVHPDFKGRTSIKKVLPVLAPELDYGKLGIGEGMTATIKWYRAAKWASLDESERQKIFSDLQEYCELDTWAMVRIYYELQKAAETAAFV